MPRPDQSIIDDDLDPNRKMKGATILNHWTGKRDFAVAQLKVAAVLAVAYIGDRWPHSYPRNDNHYPAMFWIMNVALLVAGIFTLKHDTNGSARGVQLLSRAQTEEWKGWMQWAFIMVGT